MKMFNTIMQARGAVLAATDLAPCDSSCWGITWSSVFPSQPRQEFCCEDSCKVRSLQGSVSLSLSLQNIESSNTRLSCRSGSRVLGFFFCHRAFHTSHWNITEEGASPLLPQFPLWGPAGGKSAPGSAWAEQTPQSNLANPSVTKAALR